MYFGTNNQEVVQSMQQMKSCGVIARRSAAFLLVAIFSVGLAFGQAGRVMRFEIPHEFTVGSKVLPAGKYTFSVDNSWLLVSSASNGTIRQSIITRLSGPAEFLRDGSLVFDRTDRGSILSEIWIPEEGGLLLHRTPPNHQRDVLMVSELDRKGPVSGKVAFNLTCGRCHGSDGKGDEKADKFFQTTIPRLSSAEVQAKSDAEFKELITQGSSVMPPVEIDEGGFRHRLPPQDVDAVIAYVRSLKR
jgi:mono/diheme cytochrome c family protein